jgi:hypothetical protein
MDKEPTLQELEAQADALLAAAAEVEEIPIPTTRSKRSSKKEEEAHVEKKYSIDDKVVAKLPAAALITANEKLRDLFAKGKHIISRLAGECREAAFSEKLKVVIQILKVPVTHISHAGNMCSYSDALIFKHRHNNSAYRHQSGSDPA